MTPHELAAQLTGMCYSDRIPRPLAIQAKKAGLVIVYGASDDLMEFRGAIDEEVSAFEGTTVLITDAGLFETDACAEQCRYFQEAKRMASLHGESITARWDTGDGYSWRYETAIPHATFEILEDNAPYCRGIIFALADIQKDC